MIPSCLDGVSILEQLVELALLCLELGVAANVLLADEDVGHGALLSDVLESVLDGGTVVNLVELEDVGLCAHLAEEALSGLAVGAVGLGEDSNRVAVDDLLCLGSCGHDCVWAC